MGLKVLEPKTISIVHLSMSSMSHAMMMML